MSFGSVNRNGKKVGRGYPALKYNPAASVAQPRGEHASIDSTIVDSMETIG